MLEQLTGYLAGDQADDLKPLELAFNGILTGWMALALLFILLVGVPVYYHRVLKPLSPGMRGLLVGLRTVTIVLVAFLALDPVVLAQLIKPGEQVVLLLFDDSRSMRIGDENGDTRGQRLQEAYVESQVGFEDELKRKFQIARYRVGEYLEPLNNPSDLTFNQSESDLTGGLQQAQRDMEGTTVTAAILFSDGVQQTSQDEVSVNELDDSIPVYTVGVESESPWKDIELSRIAVRRSDFDKSPVMLTAGIHAQGLQGSRAIVEVKLGSRTIQRKFVTITDNTQDHDVAFDFIPDRKDWIEYEVQVRLDTDESKPDAALAQDRIDANNSRTFVIDNRDKEYRILYVSARPNWENKFLARALKEDTQLNLSSLICISNAEPKFVFKGKKSSLANPLFEGFENEEDRPRYDEAVFIRLGFKEDELAAGFPTEAEELFQFDMVILGNIERDLFTNRQMELVRDFVEKRGGALLVTGGRNAFTEGKYEGSPLEDVLPVVMYPESERSTTTRTEDEFITSPTLEGVLSGAWTLDTDRSKNETLWEEMPPLYDLNHFPLVRAGATVEAMASSDKMEGPAPLFALQRYGEGICAAFATGDTWQWQMRLETEDNRHERIWRQLIRNMINQTMPKSILRNKQDVYTTEVPATLEWLVRNKSYEKEEGLQSTVIVTQPSDETESLPVDESIQESGIYASETIPTEPGLHRVSLLASNEKDEIVERLEEALLVESDRREFQQAQFNGAMLDAIAQRTGGQRFTLAQLPELAKSIPIPVRDESDILALHLWHLPIFYVILISCMLLEWFLRRKRGQA
jgi:uncharacterized membrane protein